MWRSLSVPPGNEKLWPATKRKPHLSVNQNSVELAAKNGRLIGSLGTSIFGRKFYDIPSYRTVIVAAAIAGLWKTFEKAGKPGWAAIVPIYNVIVMLEIVGKPLWWIVLFLIPLVNLVAAILVGIAMAGKLGRPALGLDWRCCHSSSIRFLDLATPNLSVAPGTAS